VSGRPTWVPLGTTANKQGKIAGANASGAHDTFQGIVATGVFKSFDLQVARTGLSQHEIEKLGLDAIRSVSEQPSRADSYRGAQPIHTVLFVERGSERLLGVQMAGRDGVGLRIDVFATALHAKLTLSQIEALDLAYAPPFAPVYDPVLIAATVARKDAKK
jgi:NADPH-dependent 2,4-dienoyl-CoA reductase/sulfur reductase-like enzyme